MVKWSKYRREPTLSQSNSVDKNGIPILDEVVEEREVSNAGTTPDLNAIKEEIRAEITAQIQEELGGIIQPAVSAAITQATANLEKVLKDELTFSLNKQLEELLTYVLQKQASYKDNP